jgi:hypothetical protein
MKKMNLVTNRKTYKLNPKVVSAVGSIVTIKVISIISNAKILSYYNWKMTDANEQLKTIRIEDPMLGPKTITCDDMGPDKDVLVHVSPGDFELFLEESTNDTMINPDIKTCWKSYKITIPRNMDNSGFDGFTEFTGFVSEKTIKTVKFYFIANETSMLTIDDRKELDDKCNAYPIMYHICIGLEPNGSATVYVYDAKDTRMPAFNVPKASDITFEEI